MAQFGHTLRPGLLGGKHLFRLQKHRVEFGSGNPDGAGHVPLFFFARVDGFG